MRKWTESQIKLLGVLPDDEVAKQTGFSVDAVGRKRAKMGILIRRPRRPWTESEDRLLGTEPDTKLAVRLKRSRADVRLRRIALGLQPPVSRPPYRAWTSDEDKLPGSDTDAAIAKRLGRTRFSVVDGGRKVRRVGGVSGALEKCGTSCRKERVRQHGTVG